jgi:putative hydrolase
VTVRRSVAVDTGVDLHTHSDFTDGADSPSRMADAALAAGLHTWGLSDHVRSDSGWLFEYAKTVRALRRPGLVIRCGVEAKILDSHGRLDLPADLPPLDHVLVADHQFPGPEGPVPPEEVRRRLRNAETTPEAVVTALVTATAAALAQSVLPPVVVHLFSLLPKLGLSEDDVHDDHRAELASACHGAAAAVEINEKWRCPSARTVDYLTDAGVALVAGSDAHRAADVGRWSYLHEAIGSFSGSVG